MTLKSRTIQSFTATLATLGILSVAFAAPAPANAALAENSPILKVLKEELYSLQWAMRTVRAEQAWTVTRGEGVTVAVVDSGIDGGHPALVGNVKDGFSLTIDLKKNPSVMTVTPVKAADFIDPVGHGTHVSGIIAATGANNSTKGIAPAARILPIGIDSIIDNGIDEDTDRAIALAIRTAIANKVDIISLSLGSGALEEDSNIAAKKPEAGNVVNNPNPTAKEDVCVAVSEAIAANIPVVVAAGNDGISGNPQSHPANCTGAIVVSGTTPTGTLFSGSSFDSTVTVAAPGEGILSTWPRTLWRDFPYTSNTGTSMATPLVAGILALVKSANPTFTVSQMRNAITSTAVDGGVPGVDPEYGYGIVDAAAAVGAASVRTSIPTEASLVLQVRGAISLNENKVTAYWNIPRAATLPDYYTITMYDRRGNLLSTGTQPGNAVRHTFTWTTDANSAAGAWFTLQANYLNGTHLTAAPVNLQGEPERLQDVTFTRINNAISAKGKPGPGYRITWKQADDSTADAIVIGVNGPGVYHRTTIRYDLETGLFPTSGTIAEADYEKAIGVTVNDTDYTVFATTATAPDTFGESNAEPSILKIKGGQAIVTASVDKENIYEHVMVEATINPSYIKSICPKATNSDPKCLNKVSITVTVHTLIASKAHPKGKWSTRTETLKADSDQYGYYNGTVSIIAKIPARTLRMAMSYQISTATVKPVAKTRAYTVWVK
jgi:subtilisin family serine protease